MLFNINIKITSVYDTVLLINILKQKFQNIGILMESVNKDQITGEYV